jgi:TolB-like protein
MQKFLSELQRRKVLRVASGYVVAGWIILQVALSLQAAMKLPDWFSTVIVSLLIIGFPIAVIVSWFFEFTPDGIRRTVPSGEVGRFRPQTTDFALAAALVLVLAAVVVQLTTPPAAVNTAAAPKAEPAVPPASIAVLAFADLSPEKDQEYFSDGIAEEILNVLAHTDGLKVASRTSSFQFRKTTIGVPAIAKALGVRHILEGSVRRAGETVRITAQLIDAQTDAHLWSQTFDRPLTTATIFATQDEIANAVLKALDSVLKKKTPTPKIAVAPPTNDTDAYELFLRAHRLFIDRGVGLREAVLLYERAVKADPKFVRAWGELAAAASVAPGWDVTDRDYREIAVSAAERAIALDPKQALPYAVQGNIAYALTAPPDFDSAREELDKALALAPDDVVALAWRSQLEFSIGNVEQAASGSRRCLDIDSAYLLCQYFLSLAQLAQGEKAQALDTFAKLALKGFSIAEMHLLRPLLESGDRFGAVMVAMAGAKDRALAAELMAALDEKSPNAQMQALLRLRARPSVKDALKNYLALQTALKQPITDHELFVRYGMVYVWFPEYAAYRRTADFKKLAIAMGMHTYWRKHGFPPQCRAVGKDDFECN